MKNKRIYLLDRNIISLIKDSNILKFQTDRAKINMLNKLRKLDRRTNFISPIISIIEGQTGHRESPEKVRKTIQVEALALKKLFKKAKIDNDFLNLNIDHISEIFPASDEKYKRKYDSFLIEASILLIDKCKKEKKIQIRNKIIKIAKENDIPLGSPVFFCCLSALYGYSPAQKIIKPKRNNYNPHNARSDLMVLSWLNSIKEAGVRTELSHKIIKIEFITMDIALKKFLSEITVKETKSLYDGVESTISYSKNLFPDMNQDEYLNLQDEII